MKIVYIIPGSGGTFYCQNCLRDNILAEAMRKAGHDVVIIPMYLPMFSDSETPTANAPVFFGAVNLYFKYRFPWLRKMPAWLLRIFDAPVLLKFAAKRAGSTRAAGLEGMTIDILNGESNIMSDELQKLIEWLAETEKPDIVHISNALLLGIAKEIKDKLQIPIVCSLQDEDQWVETMNAPFIEQVWELIAEKTADVDAFIAVSKYYGEQMRKKLNIPAAKLKTVHIGIVTAGYPEDKSFPEPPAIGYISKISEALGFGILAAAFLQLKADERFRKLKLYASGGVTKDNLNFIRSWQRKIARAGFAADFIIEPEFELQDRIEMLKKISLFSVPVPGGEAFGTYLLEAMAAGVPVVQPDAGGFSEIIAETGGGIVYNPNDAETLAEILKRLLNDEDELKRLSECAATAVRKQFDISNFVDNTLKVYQELCTSAFL
jgi:glycosyltransferase involved in cell wall biosynthesis